MLLEPVTSQSGMYFKFTHCTLLYTQKLSFSVEKKNPSLSGNEGYLVLQGGSAYSTYGQGATQRCLTGELSLYTVCQNACALTIPLSIPECSEARLYKGAQCPLPPPIKKYKMKNESRREVRMHRPISKRNEPTFISALSNPAYSHL